MRNPTNRGEKPSGIPSKGDRIELRRTEAGVHRRGTVFYSDQLQILVKWDDGRSQSLRIGIDRYQIIEYPWTLFREDDGLPIPLTG